MYCETANETASESRLVVSAHRADRVGKDTQVPKERAVKVGSRAIIIRKLQLRSAEPLALIAGDPGSYLNGEPTPAGWLVRLVREERCA